MGEGNQYNLDFTKVISGSEAPFKATVWVTWLDSDDADCCLTDIDLGGQRKAEGMEFHLKSQTPLKKGEQTFVGRKSGFTGSDDDDNDIDIAQWEKIIVKTFEVRESEDDEEFESPAMAWIALGNKGENVLTTQNWKE